MAMDDGDELGKEIVQQGGRLLERVVGIIGRNMMNNRAPSGQDKKRAENIEAALAPVAAEGGPLKSFGGVEYKKLLVPVKDDMAALLGGSVMDDAVELMRGLAAEGVEFYADPVDIDNGTIGHEPRFPGYNSPDMDVDAVAKQMLKDDTFIDENGMLALYVPLREPALSIKPLGIGISDVPGMTLAKDFSEAANTLLEVYDHEAVMQAYRLDQAFRVNAELVPDIKFVPDAESNIRLKHTTIAKDPDAKLMSAKLKEAGIPHAIEKIAGEKAVNIVIDPRHANATRDVVEALLNTKMYRMDEGRFPNLGELQELAVDMDAVEKAARFTIESPEAAEIWKQACDDWNIAYDLDVDHETGITLLTVPSTELSEKNENILMACKDAKGRTASMAAKKNAAKAARDQRRSPDITRKHTVKHVGQEAYEQERKANPVRDEKTSRKSADARNRDNVEPKKVQSRSK